VNGVDEVLGWVMLRSRTKKGGASLGLETSRLSLAGSHQPKRNNHVDTEKKVVKE